jgi:prepilin-type N-terminal cleavage/methylation domain-containing protein
MTMAARLRPRRREAGFSLVELLVATAVAAVVLTGGWAWCWSVCGSCAAGSGRLDAGSSLAFARRLSTSELRQCEGLVTTSDARCSATSIAFIVPSGDAATTELVTYVWDAGRRVLWRKASGSHLAEGVVDFSIAYFDDQGRKLPIPAGGDLPGADLALVRRVELSAVVRCATQTASASWQVCLRCAT